MTVFNFQRLDIYIVARRFAQLAHQAGVSDPELRDPITRAAKSAFLNVAEGLPDHRAGTRRPRRPPEGPARSRGRGCPPRGSTGGWPPVLAFGGRLDPQG